MTTRPHSTMRKKHTSSRRTVGDNTSPAEVLPIDIHAKWQKLRHMRERIPEMTPDERDVLALLLFATADEWSIAERRLDPRTIAACRRSIFDKLEVGSLVELVLTWSGHSSGLPQSGC